MTTNVTKRDEFDIGIDLSDMIMIVMMVVMASVLSGITSVAQSTAQTAGIMSAFTYEGKRYERAFTVDSELMWLTFDPPLIEIEVENDGPDNVMWSIDTPEDMRSINAGDHDGVSRLSTSRRIEILFLKCSGGRTAFVHVWGIY